jgi:site-specific DNA recombinase
VTLGKLSGKRVASYARYSSDQQREASLEDQLRRCREFITQNGGAVDERLIFKDAAVSGATMARPAMRKLQAALEAGVIDVLVVDDGSRLSRDLGDSVVFFGKLRSSGVTLYGATDGLDTSAPNAKMNFALKALLSDHFLEELGRATKRGQEGRWLAGLATGAPPFGYRSEPVYGVDNKVVGYRHLVDEQTAPTVLRIFSEYDDGQSLIAITKALNEEKVPPPRAKTKHRRKGWCHTTIRDILANPAYVGDWTWRKKRWERVPADDRDDKDRRLPKPRDPSEVRTRHSEGQRIVPQALWERVRKRAASVRAKYKGASKGASPGNRTSYPLSGVLRCGKCETPMTIMAGSSAAYYRCADRAKRGVCDNAVSVREEVARSCLFRAIHDALFSTENVDYLRKQIAERFGELSRTATADLRERTERIARTKARLDNIVAFVAEGHHSETMGAAIADLETQLKADRAALAALKEQAAAPVSLPTPEAILRRAQDLDRVFRADPTRLRQKLLRFFEHGQVLLYPQLDGTYVAMSTLLPLVVLAETKEPAVRRPRDPSLSNYGCAGRI